MITSKKISILLSKARLELSSALEQTSKHHYIISSQGNSKTIVGFINPLHLYYLGKESSWPTG